MRSVQPDPVSVQSRSNWIQSAKIRGPILRKMDTPLEPRRRRRGQFVRIPRVVRGFARVAVKGSQSPLEAFSTAPGFWVIGRTQTTREPRFRRFTRLEPSTR